MQLRCRARRYPIRSAIVGQMIMFGALALLAGACAPRGPVLGEAARPPAVDGTLSGMVRASGSNVPSDVDAGADVLITIES